MKKITAIIFPDTIPTAKTLVPLVHVFKPVVYYQPVEKVADTRDMAGTIPLTTAAGGSYRLHAPAPLGPDRDRFLTLIRDLHNRQDDYISQLGYLSLAGMGGKDRMDAESKSSLVARLLRSQGIAKEENEQSMLLLWQARLILKLAEMFTVQQEAINNELQDIQDRQNHLFTELRKELNDTFNLTEKLSLTGGRTDGLQKLRLKAWSRIFAMDKLSRDHPIVYITRHQDAIAQLIEEYEKDGADRKVQTVLRCTLPAYADGFNEISLVNKDFEHDAAPIIAAIHTAITSPDTFMQKDLSRQDAKWLSLLDQYFPDATFGRCRLALYRFQDICVKQLFLNSFGKDSDYPQTALPQADKQDIIIGLLGDCRAPGDRSQE